MFTFELLSDLDPAHCAVLLKLSANVTNCITDLIHGHGGAVGSGHQPASGTV